MWRDLVSGASQGRPLYTTSYLFRSSRSRRFGSLLYTLPLLFLYKLERINLAMARCFEVAKNVCSKLGASFSANFEE